MANDHRFPQAHTQNRTIFPSSTKRYSNQSKTGLHPFQRNMTHLPTNLIFRDHFQMDQSISYYQILK